MDDKNDTLRCCALNKNNHRCKFKCTNGDFCKRHAKMDSIIRYDQIKPKNSIDNLLSSLKKFKKKELLKLASAYKINTIGKKSEILQRVHDHISSLKIYYARESYILKIQQWYRNKVDLYYESLRGRHINLAKSVNDTDFLTFEEISQIDPLFRFSYEEEGRIYSFDLRSLKELLKSSTQNPYTRNPIPQKTIDDINKIYFYLTKFKQINLNIENNIILDETQILKHRVVKLFQQMDELDQYTNPNWFLDLNLYQLKMFYKELEDIWNYRLNLSKASKSKIVPPNGIVFHDKPYVLEKINNKNTVISKCLDVVEKLISSAENKSDRTNGCIYALFALVIVSKQAAEALPIYYSMVGNDIQVNENIFIPI